MTRTVSPPGTSLVLSSRRSSLPVLDYRLLDYRLFLILFYNIRHVPNVLDCESCAPSPCISFCTWDPRCKSFSPSFHDHIHFALHVAITPAIFLRDSIHYYIIDGLLFICPFAIPICRSVCYTLYLYYMKRHSMTAFVNIQTTQNVTRVPKTSETIYLL